MADNDGSGEGLVVQGRTKDSSNKSKHRSNKKNIECYYCHKKGYIRKNCPERQRKGKEIEDSSSNDDSVSVADGRSDCVSDNALSVIENGIHPKDEWILDSDCSYHMCPNMDWFTTYREINGGSVLMGNNVACKTVGTRTIKIKMYDEIVRTLAEVRYVPDLKKNLISLGALDSDGCKFSGEGGVIKVVKGALVLMRGNRVGNLYVLSGNIVTGKAALSSSNDHEYASTRLWHLRLGHMSEKGLTILSNQNFLCGTKTSKVDFCERCIFEKHQKVSFKTGIHRTKDILDYVHSDVWGPYKVYSKGRSRFMLTFIDDYLRKVWVYTLKTKDQTFVTFKQWNEMVEKQIGRKVKKLRIGNGREYRSTEFENYCMDHSIVRHYTTTKTPQQNRVTKRMNRTILERARCLLFTAGLSKDF
ncbi:hypothetical protein MRB53_026707 [Persea americana]|uniref:Uncharacterized protein n=1 Tax=Persea americana TaxID=3435 RepID=A0ACC2LIT7_PERAE|nr:hypothetical protein MRB53_026707 [Persea americana]